MKTQTAHNHPLHVLSVIDTQTKHVTEPFVFKIAQNGATPFQILIATILSLRTKDVTTKKVYEALMAQAQTASAIVKLPLRSLQQILFSANYYRRKAMQIQQIAQIITEHTHVDLLHNKQFLLRLPGVGNKTANLVLGLAYAIPSICVDVHVHRIVNRLGMVHTQTAHETEQALAQLFPTQRWIAINRSMVKFGMSICKPRLPLCRLCALERFCPKIGVKPANVTKT